jgi:glucose-1-phosphate adenylyltransferase
MKKLGISEFQSNEMRHVTAIVLGGGRGTRLDPLTRVRAKPAVPLCGRYRLIDIPLSNCIHSDVNRIAVLTQFNNHSLNRHVINTYKFDIFGRGFVQVLPASQTASIGDDWYQGTADAVRKQMVNIHDPKTKYYLILSGDQLYRMDYRALMATHQKKRADITVAALPVNQRDARGFGIMKVQKNGRIREFVEKPTEKSALKDLVTPDQVFKDFNLQAKGKPYLGSMGVYMFNADVLEDLLDNHPDWIDFGSELLPGALQSRKVFSHMFSDYWEDIGTVRSYFDVSMAMTRPNPPFKFLDPDHPIFTHERVLPGARIVDSYISNAIICGGTKISHATIKNSIIGTRSVINNGVNIDHAVITGAERFEEKRKRRRQVPMGIGENTTITRAIIDHNARIGKNVTITGGGKLKDCDGEGFSIRDGIVVVLKNAVIPDGTVIA